MARAGAACHSQQTHPGTPQGGRHSQSSSKGAPRWLWARGWGPVAGRGAPLSPCRRRNKLPLRDPLSWPVVTRCPRCLHLPAQAGGRGHVLSLAGVSFSPSQEAEATPPSSEPRPPHCLQAAEQAPTPMQQSQPPSPGTGAGRVQAAQAAHEHAPPQENTPRIRSFTLTQRGRWGHRGGCDTHTRGDNGNKYGVGVARAGPRAPWPEPVPTPQPPP